LPKRLIPRWPLSTAGQNRYTALVLDGVVLARKTAIDADHVEALAGQPAAVEVGEEAFPRGAAFAVGQTEVDDLLLAVRPQPQGDRARAAECVGPGTMCGLLFFVRRLGSDQSPSRRYVALGDLMDAAAAPGGFHLPAEHSRYLRRGPVLRYMLGDERLKDVIHPIRDNPALGLTLLGCGVAAFEPCRMDFLRRHPRLMEGDAAV
jgi:hypothetical protein